MKYFCRMNTFNLLEMNDKLELVRISPKYSKLQYRYISGVAIYDVLYFMTLKG